MRKALPAVLVLLSLLVAATAPAPAAAATQDDGLTPDGVTVHVTIQDDGDARWVVSTSYVLNDSSSLAAFEDVAAQFERGQGTIGFSIRAFEQVAPEVGERTGRDMAIQNPSWSSAVENESGLRRGYLRLSFTWTNFANVQNETVTLDGAFEGGWFGDLGPDQTLIIQPPSGFDVSSAQPSHETVNGTLRWTGPVEFGPNEPVARFDRQPTPPAIPWASIAGAVITALVIGGIIAYAWFWRTNQTAGSAPGEAPAESEGPAGETGSDAAGSNDAGDEGATGEGAGGADNGVGAGETGATEAGAGAGAGAAAGAGAGAGSSDGAGAGAGSVDGEAPGGASETEPQPELLSDEERVERLLEKHGGRMKQAKIVDETRWSNAKVSQLLSQMAEEGRIEKLRIGRENLISIPEDESGDDSGR